MKGLDSVHFEDRNINMFILLFVWTEYNMHCIHMKGNINLLF